MTTTTTAAMITMIMTMKMTSRVIKLGFEVHQGCFSSFLPLYEVSHSCLSVNQRWEGMIEKSVE